MTEDLYLIKKLEKEIGEKLKRVMLRDVMGTNGFSLDENGNVNGLNLEGMKLEKIPLIITKLHHLKRLKLYKNKISDISILKELVNLNYLDLSINQISDISMLKELRNLTVLGLNSNQISDISMLKKLVNLNYLDLSSNQISELPEEILELPMEIKWEWRPGGGIFLADNPLEYPPVEIVKKGKKAINNYFQSLAGEKQSLNEVKVLLVGDGGAGKTSLVKRLLEKGFDKNEPQTHGIKINPWNINVNNIDIKVHLWDFGGQEIMHATHQFFFSKRSLYILVLDSRKDEKTEYWLKQFESFGGDSPVLVVINKVDENPSFDVNRRFLLDKYKNIKGFYRVSCAKNKGIKEFSRVLENEMAQVDLIKTTWANSWFNVKTQLEQMTEPFISYDKYKKICEAENIIDRKGQETLVDFLNDLGVILHFKDFELEDTHVLEPKWITEAVYKIINSKELSQCRGVLNLKMLDHILQKKTNADYDYPRNKYKYIITLMKKFELCYRIDDKTVLIPDLLEVQEPLFVFDYDSSLKFIFQYEFLPRSVMPRFIVNMHEDIKGELRWRTGVVLEDKNFQSTAIVKVDHEAKRMYIYVNGEQKRDYFAAILVTLRRINHSFEKLNTTEMVPMPDDQASTVSYKHLIRLEKRGIDVYLPGDSEKEYKVKDLLGTIAPAKATEEEILQLLRKIKSDTDTFESLFKKANDIALLPPNFFGLGLNLNNLIQKILPKKGSKKKTSK